MIYSTTLISLHYEEIEARKIMKIRNFEKKVEEKD
jgi:hypothetical protein